MSNDSDLKYNLRGVSASKEDVHKAVKNLDKGLFPNAFCKIFPDFLSNDPGFCNLMSSDGSGTKSILAYLYWKETGDPSVWQGIAEDALVMNLDDLLCVGAKGPFLYSSLINRNKHLIPGAVIEEIISGGQHFINKMASHGIEIHYTGGETADLGDSVRTITVDGSMICRMKRDDVIDAGEIAAGDVIVGLASDGKANYEKEYNSGIGSNGLTSARHDVLSKFYFENYPESFDPHTSPEVIYNGSKRITDIDEKSGLPVGKLLLSPTRSFAPVLSSLLKSHRHLINGIVHCTGGGQTKVLHFVNNVKIIKDSLFELPPVFQLIADESGTSWKELYKVFNMGHRMEVYGNREMADDLIRITQDFGIDAQIIGRVEASNSKQLVIDGPQGCFEYA